MTSHIFRYSRPLGADESDPPLRVEGVFPPYVAGDAFEGRLSIIDNIGKCTVEYVDGNLPDGYWLYVDNFTNEVVLKWPEFLSGSPHTDVPNGDFEAGDDGRWNLPPGFAIRGDDGVHGGLLACRMNKGINGEFIVNGTKCRVTPGTTITLTGQVDQGASSKNNTGGRVMLTWYTAAGGIIYRSLGNYVVSGSDGEWLPSTVTATAPPGVHSVQADLMFFRKKNNETVGIDTLTWDLVWYGGQDSDEEYDITLRVRDSANRVAYWYGNITETYTYFTSRPYNLVIEPPDAFWLNAEVLSGEFGLGLQEVPYQLPEGFTLSATVVSGELRADIQLVDQQVPEGFTLSATVQSGTLVFGGSGLITYTNGAPEGFTLSADVQSGTLALGLITYTNGAPEGFTLSASVIGGTLV